MDSILHFLYNCVFQMYAAFFKFQTLYRTLKLKKAERRRTAWRRLTIKSSTLFYWRIVYLRCTQIQDKYLYENIHLQRVLGLYSFSLSCFYCCSFAWYWARIFNICFWPIQWNIFIQSLVKYTHTHYLSRARGEYTHTHTHTHTHTRARARERAHIKFSERKKRGYIIFTRTPSRSYRSKFRFLVLYS